MEKTKSNKDFGSALGFILTAAGSAVGLGNLWSFPYKTGANGGAAFVFVYLISVLTIGSVVMIAEVFVGKRAKANAVTSYAKIKKGFGVLGMFSIIVPFIIICYYSVLGGYSVKYTLNSFNNNSNIFNSFTGNVGEVTLYTALFILVSLMIVMGGIKAGLEKACKILMPILLLILLGIAIYSLTLGEGVAEGVKFFLQPDFSALGFKGILAAMGQAFFSLSLGVGVMVCFGSHCDKKISIGKSVLAICLFDTLVGILAGLAIFPSISHFLVVHPEEQMTFEGMALLFVTMPRIFETLGVFGNILSFLFFGMVFIAAVTSNISSFEIIAQFLLQKFKLNRKKVLLIIGALSFLVSIPVNISMGMQFNGNNSFTIFGKNLLNFLDDITNAALMPLCGLVTCIAVGWFIDPVPLKERFNPKKTWIKLKEEGLNLSNFIGIIFTFMVKYVTPLLVAAVYITGFVGFIQEGIYGVIVILTSLGLIGIACIVYFCFFYNKYTGTNEDEDDATLKVN